MKTISTYLLLMGSLFLLACGGEKTKKNSFSYEKKKTKHAVTTGNSKQRSNPENLELSNKGIGPIMSISIPSKIDKSLAKQGKTLFKTKCASCHRTHKKFTGPPMAGILERRSPEWVMNMILNPVEMIKKDKLAKTTFLEYNTVIMGDQQVSKSDARGLLEYFRTLD